MKPRSFPSSYLPATVFAASLMIGAGAQARPNWQHGRRFSTTYPSKRGIDAPTLMGIRCPGSEHGDAGNPLSGLGQIT